MFNWSELSKRAVDLGKKAVEIVSEAPPQNVAGGNGTEDEGGVDENGNYYSYYKEENNNNENNEQQQQEQQSQMNRRLSGSSGSDPSPSSSVSNWASQLREIVAPRPNNNNNNNNNSKKSSASSFVDTSSSPGQEKKYKSFNNNNNNNNQYQNNNQEHDDFDDYTNNGNGSTQATGNQQHVDPLLLVRHSEKIASLQEEVDNLQAALGRVSRERDDYQSLLQEHHTNKSLTQTSLQLQNDDDDGAAGISSNHPQEQIQQLRTKNESLRSEIASLKSRKSNLDSLKRQSESTISQLQIEFKDLESERESTKSEVANLEKDLKHVNDQTMHLSGLVSRLQQEISQMKLKKSDLVVEAADKQDDVESLEEEVEKLHQEHKHEETEIQNSIRTKSANSNNNKQGDKESQLAVTELIASLRHLQVQKDDEIHSLKQNNSKQNDIIQNLHREIAKYESSVVPQLRHDVDEKNHTIIKLKQEYTNIQNQLHHQQQENQSLQLRASESASSSSSISEFQQQLQQQQKDAELQAQNHEKELQNTIQQHKQELSTLTDKAREKHELLQQNFSQQLQRLEQDSQNQVRSLLQEKQDLLSKLDALQSDLAKSKYDFETLQKETVTRLTDAQRQGSSTGQRVQMLESTLTELRQEHQRLKDCVNTSLEIGVQALGKAGMSLDRSAANTSSDTTSSPSNSNNNNNNNNQHQHPCVLAISQICTAWEKEREVRARDSVRLTQWAQTYEQARVVNQQLNEQLQTLQNQLENVREDGAMQNAGVDRLKDMIRHEQEQARVASSQLHTTFAEKQELLAHFDKAKEEIARLQLALASQGERLRALEAEHMNHDAAMSDKESELEDARRASDNLQAVLERFQLDKQRDIQEQAKVLNFELDDLRAKLHHELGENARHRDDVDALERSHRRELSAKQSMIAALQNKLTELRGALEEAVEKLSDKHTIDKRIVTGLILNYIHSASDETRSDTMDIVRAMSGLLSWDQEANEKSGLVSGPANPKKKGAQQQQGRGIFGWISGGGSSNNNNVAAKPQPAPVSGGGGGGDAGAANNKSLGEMWVDFLMKESGANLANKQNHQHEPSQDQQQQGAALSTSQNENQQQQREDYSN